MRSGERAKQGFTYIELAVVLLILTVTAALAFPTIHSLTTSDLKMSARHLIRTVYFLADRSAATKQTYRLYYSLERQEYWASVRSSDGEFSPVGDSFLARTALPESVRFKDATTRQQGKVTLGEAYTDFYPVGLVDKTILHLMDDHERALTLVVNPLTGRVKVYDGYWEETRS